MDNAQLKDFVERQRERGMSVEQIREHLRGQGWEDADIAAATNGTPHDSAANGLQTPHPHGRADRRKGWHKPGLIALAVFIVLSVIAGFQAWRHYALAKAVREKLRYVHVSGNATGSLAAFAAGAREPGAESAPFDLFNLTGTADSSDLEHPRADFRVEADPAGGVAAAVQRLTLGTDARMLGISLLTLGATGKFVGGADIRLIDNDVYLRFVRPPLAPGGQGNVASVLAEALMGPNLLSNAWLRIPSAVEPVARGGAGTARENDLLWTLMLRPDSRIFGHSEELKFLGKRKGEEIRGVPTEIHRYEISGPWMTAQLSGLLERAELQKPFAVLQAVQKILTGDNSAAPTDGKDTVEISDGEMEVWAGKPDTLPQRIRLAFKIREGTKSPAQMQVRAELDFSYGAPTRIETPSPAMSPEDLERQLTTLKSLTDLF